MVYAVVRAGGRQEKVEVGTIVTMDRIKADKDGNVELAAVLLVDGDKITSDSTSLANVKVTAEVLNDLRGPKIVIQKFVGSSRVDLQACKLEYSIVSPK